MDGSGDEDDWQDAGPPLRAAGRARPAEDEVPEFGPGQLIGEIDCARPPHPRAGSSARACATHIPRASAVCCSCDASACVAGPQPRRSWWGKSTGRFAASAECATWCGARAATAPCRTRPAPTSCRRRPSARASWGTRNRWAPRAPFAQVGAVAVRGALWSQACARGCGCESAPDTRLPSTPGLRPDRVCSLEAESAALYAVLLTRAIAPAHTGAFVCQSAHTRVQECARCWKGDGSLTKLDSCAQL